MSTEATSPRPEVPPIKELRAAVYKSEEIYGPIPWISKVLIHPHVSIYFARLFLLTGLNGNQATFVMMLTAFVGALSFFWGGTAGYLTGAFLMTLSWVLDHSDGEVRRFLGEDSSYNIYMDRFTHRVSYPLMHIGMGFSLWRSAGDPRYLLFGCLVAYFYQLSVEHRLDKALINKDRKNVDLAPLRSWRLVLSEKLPLLAMPLRYAFAGYAHVIQNNAFYCMIVIGVLLGLAREVYVAYGLLLIFNWLLNTALDFTIAFRDETVEYSPSDADSLEIRMH